MSEFSEKEILKMRRYLAKKWRQKVNQIMDLEAIHYLRKEREDLQSIGAGESDE